MPFWHAIERVTLAAWLGGLLWIGPVVAPLLFAHLDRASAGLLAGRLFFGVALITMLCCGVLLLLLAWQWRSAVWRQWRFWLLLVLLAVALLNSAVLYPQIDALRQIEPVLRDEARLRQLHTLAQGLYVVSGLGALWLVFTGVLSLPYRSTDTARDSA